MTLPFSQDCSNDFINIMCSLTSLTSRDTSRDQLSTLYRNEMHVRYCDNMSVTKGTIASRNHGNNSYHSNNSVTIDWMHLISPWKPYQVYLVFSGYFSKTTNRSCYLFYRKSKFPWQQLSKIVAMMFSHKMFPQNLCNKKH